ncbi:hypothetical protein [Cytobacillus gottheilii]|uniref:hypothetical protein n=1 Tax=Cytobacillus gottheilii TaxID=859144 RepID=UPI002493F7E9|nr:hypothetical protein [Cytobacillus gottheilii]
MCLSHNIIELQAYETSKKIQENSLFKCVRLDFAGGNSLGIQSQSDFWKGYDLTAGIGSSLITKVILEDTEGTLYSVEPNANGLRFAEGKINYKEYRKLQKRKDLNAYACFLGVIVIFFMLMLTVMKYLI